MDESKKIKLLKNKVQKLENENLELKEDLEYWKRKAIDSEEMIYNLEKIQEKWKKALADIKEQRAKFKKMNQDLKEFRSVMLKGKIPV